MKHSILDQLKIELRSLFAGYPKFVYSKNSTSSLDGIPVFVYHTIEPELFESHLNYLKKNGYNTLSINDFYEIITSQKVAKNPKQVLLTIDDARSSVWRFAYPLLKKYEMKATVFIIPGVTKEGETKRKTIENSWNGECELSEIESLDPEDNTLCNWIENITMYKSGVIDIESHTLFHKEVFTSKKIVDFITPETDMVPYNFIGAAYFENEDSGKKVNFSEYFGLPLFESAPIMFAEPSFKVTNKFVEKCKVLYKNNLLQNGSWKEEIKKLVEKNTENSDYFVDLANSKERTEKDLDFARKEIQNRLGSEAGNHLCLPWTKGNENTIEICKELSIKSVFWGVIKNKKINKPNDDPYYITRLKNDFILRLPGKGRKNLLSIYKDKIARRISGEKVY